MEAVRGLARWVIPDLPPLPCPSPAREEGSGPTIEPHAATIFFMARPSEQQEKALRELRGLRTAPEWDRDVQRIDRALVEGRRPELSPEEYERLLAPVIRLRLRRALMHALEAGVVSSPAAAQILGYIGHGGKNAYLEDLLDGRRFPNLASADFAFVREIKERLHQDVQQLRSVASPS